MTQSKVSSPGTFSDFVAWATSQRLAGERIGLSDSMVSLILAGKRPLLPEYAIRAEQVSEGLFRADDLRSDIEFHRDDSGRVVGHIVRAQPNNPDDAQSAAFVAENNS
jgi:DNA-binding transcriptional regulator YdaS (Cro superfamily)